MEPITITFTLTEDDYMRSNHQFNSRKMNYYVYTSLTFGVVLVVTIFLIAIRSDYFDKLSDWVPVLLVLIGFVAYLFFERNLIKQQIRRDKELTKPVRLEFSEPGVKVTSALAETLYNWQYFREVYENAEFFYLSLTKKPKTFLFVPKRFFASPEQLEQLRTLSKQQLSPRQGSR